MDYAERHTRGGLSYPVLLRRPLEACARMARGPKELWDQGRAPNIEEGRLRVEERASSQLRVSVLRRDESRGMEEVCQGVGKMAGVLD